MRKTSIQAAAWIALLTILLPLIAVYTPILAESYRTAPSVILSVPILSVGFGFFGMSLLWQAPLLAGGHTKTVSAIAVSTSLINLGANAVLIPRLGEVGAAWGTFIAFGCMMIATFVAVRVRGWGSS